MADDNWIVDRIPIGPGLTKKHGRLDVNIADPRFTDPSLTTPSPHAYTHADGGSDEVTLAQSQVTGLVDDLDALNTAIATIDDLVLAALAEIIPAWTEDDIGKSLTVFADLTLGWADASALIPYIYDTPAGYDNSSTYDEGYY